MARPRQGYALADGSKVPGVTSILSRFRESGGLIRWAYNLGKSGGNMDEERDRAADAGSLAHSMVEMYVKGRPDIETLALDVEPEIAKGAVQGFKNWLAWKGSTRLEVTAWEKPLLCEHYRYGGTPDALLEQDGVRALGDWKGTSAIYPEAAVQLAAYAHLFADIGMPIEAGFHIVRFSRTNADFTHAYFAELREAFDLFLLLRRAYDLDKALSKRIK